MGQYTHMGQNMATHAKLEQVNTSRNVQGHYNLTSVICDYFIQKYYNIIYSYVQTQLIWFVSRGGNGSVVSESVY